MTLINAVLKAIPIYFFSFFRVPSKIIVKLEAIQRRFLWGGGSEHRKIAWVNWKTVCQPKDKGGLGIKDIKIFNSALMAKWHWDLFHKQEELWAKVIKPQTSNLKQTKVRLVHGNPFLNNFQRHDSTN